LGEGVGLATQLPISGWVLEWLADEGVEEYVMSIAQGRMSDRIRQILSELLRREVADPRLKNVTVTEVTLDRELMFANVYVNALGDESRQNEILEGLRRAGGFLRRETGKRIRLRNTPELHSIGIPRSNKGNALTRLPNT
jgi:ribosome-binding factor A